MIAAASTLLPEPGDPPLSEWPTEVLMARLSHHALTKADQVIDLQGDAIDLGPRLVLATAGFAYACGAGVYALGIGWIHFTFMAGAALGLACSLYNRVRPLRRRIREMAAASAANTKVIDAINAELDRRARTGARGPIAKDRLH